VAYTLEGYTVRINEKNCLYDKLGGGRGEKSDSWSRLGRIAKLRGPDCEGGIGGRKAKRVPSGGREATEVLRNLSVCPDSPPDKVEIWKSWTKRG